MKNILYIAFLFLFLSSCSNNKAHKKEVTVDAVSTIEDLKEADNKTIISVFGSERVVNNEKLSHQKIKQIIEISNLLQQDKIDKDLKNNSLRLAKRLYKNKDLQSIEKELINLKLPKNDSLVVYAYQPISNETIDALNRKIKYTFLIDIYVQGIKTKTLNKNASIEFSNIETELEGKIYYSIGSKIIEIK